MSDSLTVSDLTRRLRALIDNNPDLQNLAVEGEVAEFKTWASGHSYFQLKDASASIKCVLWRTTAARIRSLPQSGDRVRVRGSVSTYEARSEYQLTVTSIEPLGLGDLYLDFERLKRRLEAEGLFDPARKRPLPAFPQTIGIVTSPQAAALQDVLNVLRRRFPLARLILAPTLVQGAEAPPQIARAIARAAAQPGVEVVLVCRGGGSLEDLWAFNDERVVRAIADCPLPVITGVGHETDFTLADFAADVRAPTPSAAAELLTPDIAELAAGVSALHSALIGALQDGLAARRDALAGEQRVLAANSPVYTIRRLRQRLDDWSVTSLTAARNGLELRRARLRGLEGALYAASPQAILDKGYALVTTPDGTRITGPADAPVGAPLTVRLKHGTIQVERTE